MQEDFLTQPPLPRFRYDVSTGEWRKEVTQSPVDALRQRKQTLRTVMLASDTPESSFDYFLRQSHAKERKGDATVVIAEENRARTLHHIAHFEGQHQAYLRAEEGRRAADGVSTPVKDSSPPTASAHANAHGTPLSLHPIFGLLVGASLSTVATALCEVAKGPLVQITTPAPLPAQGAVPHGTVTAPRSSPGPAASPPAVRELPLSFEDFTALLSMLPGSPSVLSEAYLRERVYETLPMYCAASDSVCAIALFSFIARNTFHPVLDRNVAALFEAFDAGQRGAIPTTHLRAAHLREWADRNVFGLLRLEWSRFAAVLEREETLGVGQAGATDDPSPPSTRRTVPETRAKWLTADMVMALLCSSPRLFKVANTVDLEGSTLRARETER